MRVLTISDFDPSGYKMPVSFSRKLEFLIRTAEPNLHVQVRPIALTYEQCVEFRLPRTPIKETDKRAAAFESRFGEGATELDALEALRPGELRRIVEREIGWYFDPDLEDAVSDAENEHQEALDEITDGVHAEHADELAAHIH